MATAGGPRQQPRSQYAIKAVFANFCDEQGQLGGNGWEEMMRRAPGLLGGGDPPLSGAAAGAVFGNAAGDGGVLDYAGFLRALMALADVRYPDEALPGMAYANLLRHHLFTIADVDMSKRVPVRERVREPERTPLRAAPRSAPLEMEPPPPPAPPAPPLPPPVVKREAAAQTRAPPSPPAWRWLLAVLAGTLIAALGAHWGLLADNGHATVPATVGATSASLDRHPALTALFTLNATDGCMTLLRRPVGCLPSSWLPPPPPPPCIPCPAAPAPPESSPPSLPSLPRCDRCGLSNVGT